MSRIVSPRLIESLRAADPWTAYTVLASVPGAVKSPEEIEAARKASIASSLPLRLVAELEAWPGTPLASHKSAEQLFHKLMMAASLGLRKGDPGADAIARKIMSVVSAEGPFALPMKIGEAYGGTGEELGAWALCDAPIILRALVKMGYGDEIAVTKAYEYLVGLARENGFPCAVSASLGSWRGPGRKADPCPFATLIMLELILEVEGGGEAGRVSARHAGGGRGEGLAEGRGSQAARWAAECLLGLWERSRESHPYIFYMGDDFRKLKAPLLWYDLLHLLEALTKAPWLRGDARLEEMLDILEAKADPEFGFTPESVYLAWKKYDFGQKKKPSPYLSALALAILSRAGRIAIDLRQL